MAGRPDTVQVERRRPHGRREEILDAASRRLNAAGVSLGSLADIAGALGITRAALYAYVEDREDLVFQCYRRACEIMEERLAAARAAHEDPLHVAAAFIGKVLDPGQPEAAALSELRCLRPAHQALIEEQREALVGRIAGILAEGQARGQVRAADTRVAAHAILSLVYWLKLAPRWLAEEATLTKERLEAAAKTLLFEGVATGPTEIPYAHVDLSRLAAQVDDIFDRKAVAAAKLDRLLAVASRLFNQRGVETTSVDEIAAETGVTKRTIYNHFPDKLALISACQLRGYRIFIDVGEQASAWPGRRAEALGAAIHASVLCSFRPELAPLRVFSGVPEMPEEADRLAREASLRLQTVYAVMFQQGIAEGSLRDLEMRPIQLAMAGVSGWVGASAEGDAEHIASETARLVLFGLRA